MNTILRNNFIALKMKKLACVFLCLLFVILLTSCSAKKDSSANAPELELQASIATTTWLEKNFGIINDLELRELISRMQQRLSAAASQIAKQRETYYPESWDIFVLNTEIPNAFSTGSGVIFLTRGLIKESQSEAELASIISHEMAHQMLAHIQRAIAEQGLSDQMPEFQFALDHELDADELGFMILERARYDVRYSLSALTTVYRAQDKNVSTAPDWLNERSVEIQRLIASVPSLGNRRQSSREFLKVRKRL